MQEKQFIQKGARNVRLHEFLQKEIEGAGYSHADIVRTPTSTKIVIYAQRPGLVIGRGGSRIKELTNKMETDFEFENPQIEVNEIEEPDSDAQVVAQSMASWLEKGGRAKRVGYTYLRRMKEAGVPGAEIEISGKLSGNRGRTEKFSFGYVKICGNTAKENVEKGYELARTKPGAIGVKIRMMKEMPDFMSRNVEVEEEIIHKTEEEASEKPKRIAKIIEEAENMTAAEIERAVEELEDIQTSDVSVDEVREVFEEGDAEVDSSEEESEDKPDEQADTDEKEETQEETEESENTEETQESESEPSEEYEKIVSGTITDAKDMLEDIEEPDYQAALEAEKEDKNRTTFIDWLESRA